MKKPTITEIAEKITVEKLVTALVVIALGTIGMTLFFLDMVG